MDQLIIRGGNRLMGEINVCGAKNAALPVIAAALLTDEPLRISNVPHLEDVTTILQLLGRMGARMHLYGHMSIEVDASSIHSHVAPYELVRMMRASILVLGPLLARFGKAVVSLPGGCAIGSRPVNYHLEGLRKMGANLEMNAGYIEGTCSKLKGAVIDFERNTVTGTENLMMAATLAKGTTLLRNAATEPEIVNLAQCLNAMGAKIEGAGTGCIEIEGVDSLKGAHHELIADRIEAGTYLVGAIITGGKIRLNRTNYHYMGAVLEKLEQAGADITTGTDEGVEWIELEMNRERPKAVDIKTAPYPFFPTDMQAQFAVLNSLAQGDSTITETVFEGRFMYLAELERMGACFRIDGNSVHIKGAQHLNGATVAATDLRASASLVLASLVAKETSLIENIYHIDRGYECLEEKLSLLGADIRRVRGIKLD